MISRDFCREQITRLYQFKGYPKLNFEGDNASEVKAALKELVDSLHDCAETEERAREVIDFFCHESQSKECPLPPDIRRAVYATEPPEEWSGWTKEDIGPLCTECQSWGSVERDGKHERCSCKSGKEFPQALLDSMNNPKPKPETGLRSYGGEDFDATVRRAILARINA